MLECGFSGIRHHLMAKIARLGDQSRAHRRGDTDLCLATAFRSGESGIVFTQIADRRSRQQPFAEFLL